MKIIIAGDLCPKNRVAQLFDEHKYEDVLSEVSPIVRSSDFSIVNLEAPIVGNNGSPIEKSGPCLKCSSSVIGALQFAGFTAVTLANNHILDQGEFSCIDTKSKVEEAGIRTVGVGENIKDASSVLYKKIGSETLAVINCCEHEFSIATSNTAGANPLNPIQQYYKIQEARKKADFVLVIVHGGSEYCQLPSPRMQEIYRYFIDCGADAVVNHHQHCYSGYEVYKEKPIFYGLGNFVFDWNGRSDSSWNEGFMLELRFEKGKNSTFEMYPYIQCREIPSVRIMTQQERDKFEKRIISLNEIIENEDTLKTEWESWVGKHSRGYLSPFLPYNNRWTRALFSRGWLPNLITKKKQLHIINHLDCESHLERLKYVVRHN